MNDFKNFICKYKSEKGCPFTHTSMGSPKISLDIPNEKLPEFYKLYNVAKMRGEQMHYTEKPLNPSPLRVDLDFRFAIKRDENQNAKMEKELYYTYEHIKNIINEYFKIITNILDIEKDHLEVYVMEKANPIEERGLIKDGIHLIFPNIIINNSIQHYIRSKLLERPTILFNGLYLVNEYDNVIDKAIIDHNTWQMYGSCKPNMQTYEVTHIIKYNNEKLEEVDYDASDPYFTLGLVSKLSMRKDNEKVYEIKEEKKEEIEEFIKIALPKMDSKMKNLIKDALMTTNKNLMMKVEDQDTIDLAERLVLECLNSNRSDNYQDWIYLGWALRNIDHRLLNCWIEFSKNSLKFKGGECEEYWDNMKEDTMGMGTLRWWAKNDNPDKYNDILNETIFPFVDKAIASDGTHYDVALVIYKKYHDVYKCTGEKSWYRYDKKQHRWVNMLEALELNSKISTEIHLLFLDRSRYWTNLSMKEGPGVSPENVDVYKAKAERALNIAQKCKMTPFKGNLLKECKSFFIEEKFEQLLDSRPHLLGFTNGVYDFKFGMIRAGNPNDYISYSTNIKYVKYNENSIEAKEIKTFLEKVFINENVRKYFIHQTACAIDGSVRQERFYILTGSGSNGKSRLMEMLQKCLGDYYCIMPISLLTNKRASSNTAQCELERTKGRRIAVMQEPNKEDKINVGLMKELSGNDVIQARTLFKEPIEFKPQFKMFLTCNKLPDVPSSDDGTWRRIRLIDFLSKFCEKPSKTKENEFKIDYQLNDKMDTWTEMFLSMLIYERSKLNFKKLVEPMEVLLATEKYGNSQNIISQFIEEVIVEDKKVKCKLTLTDAHNEFKTWFRTVHSGTNKHIMTREELKTEMEKKFGVYNSKTCWRNIKIRVIEETEQETDLE
tara:strand:+ start:2702 stop:5368 length:2667 start_codon:yes stop_codon:yes gene_type:complete